MHLPALILPLLLSIPSEAGLIFRRAPQERVVARQNSLASGFHDPKLLTPKASESTTPAGASPTTEVFFEYTVDASDNAVTSTNVASSTPPTNTAATVTPTSASSSTSTVIGALFPPFSRSINLGSLGPPPQPDSTAAAGITTSSSSTSTVLAATTAASSTVLTFSNSTAQTTSPAQATTKAATPTSRTTATTKTSLDAESSSDSATVTKTVYVTVQPSADLSTGPAASFSSSAGFESTVTLVVTKPTVTVTEVPVNSPSVGTTSTRSVSPSPSQSPTTLLRHNTEIPTGAPNIRVPTAVVVLPVATARVSPTDYQLNLAFAKNYNDLCRTLDKKSACTRGQSACIGGDLYVCDDVGFEFREDCTSKQLGCFGMPMNTTLGVMVGCWEPSFANSVVGGAAGRPPSLPSPSPSLSTSASSPLSSTAPSTSTTVSPPPPSPPSSTQTPTSTSSPKSRTTITSSSPPPPPPTPSTTLAPSTSETLTLTTSTYSKTHTAEFIEVTVISHHKPKTTTAS